MLFRPGQRLIENRFGYRAGNLDKRPDCAAVPISRALDMEVRKRVVLFAVDCDLSVRLPVHGDHGVVIVQWLHCHNTACRQLRKFDGRRGPRGKFKIGAAAPARAAAPGNPGSEGTEAGKLSYQFNRRPTAPSTEL